MKRGFVVSAVLYPLLVIALTLILGVIAMSDNRRKILDNMKLEVSEESETDPEMSNSALYYKMKALEEAYAELSSRMSEERMEELKSQAKLEAFPVGSIFISTTSTNPSSYIGGTWVAYGQGRTLMGLNASDSNFNSLGKTGGESSSHLTASNLPSHSHTVTPTGSVNSTFTGTSVTTSSNGAHTHTTGIKGNEAFTPSGVGTSGKTAVVVFNQASGVPTTSSGSHNHTVVAQGNVTSTFTGNSNTTSNTGSGTSFSNLSPYVVVYFWKRTA